MSFIIIGSAVITAGGMVGAGAIQANQQKNAANTARANAARLEGDIKDLEELRSVQNPIINPYAGAEDLSSMIQDLSSFLDNPYDNLGVATKAAEIQIEQTDIALANTLDALQASGASAGGATALAQAAAAGKKSVAASIEAQEAQNEKLKAQGESQLNQQKMAEAQRVQSALFGEATRQQQIESQGELFMYKEKDNRFLEQLDRKQAQMTGQEQAAAQRSADAANIMGAGLQGAGNIIGAGISGMASNMYNKPIPTPISTGNVGKITSAADQKLSSELGD
tara:strand:- start:370 stop:1212 length:843 start_codon:yes stop_codon:yes gene_type:complete